MKYIKINDTYAKEDAKDVYDFLETDNSMLIAVDDNEFDLLQSDISYILNNQEIYEDIGVYEAITETIKEHNASIISPDFEFDW